jgi:hypothetical protein
MLGSMADGRSRRAGAATPIRRALFWNPNTVAGGRRRASHPDSRKPWDYFAFVLKPEQTRRIA